MTRHRTSDVLPITLTEVIVLLFFVLALAFILLLVILFGGMESWRRWKARNTPESQAFHDIPTRTRVLVAAVYLFRPRLQLFCAAFGGLLAGLHGVAEHLPALIHTDPLRIEPQVRRLETIDQHAGRPWPVEAALWDLIGQVHGQPAWRLFGGVSDRVDAYASLGARRRADETAGRPHGDGGLAPRSGGLEGGMEVGGCRRDQATPRRWARGSTRAVDERCRSVVRPRRGATLRHLAKEPP